MGVIPEEQAVDQMCARLPKRLHEAARLCMLGIGISII